MFRAEKKAPKDSKDVLGDTSGLKAYPVLIPKCRRGLSLILLPAQRTCGAKYRKLFSRTSKQVMSGNER
jgi:hypothetical protein